MHVVCPACGQQDDVLAAEYGPLLRCLACGEPMVGEAASASVGAVTRPLSVARRPAPLALPQLHWGWWAALFAIAILGVILIPVVWQRFSGPSDWDVHWF